MARQGGGRTVGGSARQKLLLLGEDQRSGDAGKEKSTFFPSGKEKPSSAEQPGQCRLSCVRSLVENSQTNELFGPGRRGALGIQRWLSLAASQAASEVVCAVMVIGFQLIAAKL